MRLQRSIKITLYIALLLLTLLVVNTYGPTAGDVTAGRILNTLLAPAIPTEPPIADKISFDSLNGLGEAVVTGAPGAVLPLANVLLINVNTHHQD